MHEQCEDRSLLTTISPIPSSSQFSEGNPAIIYVTPSAPSPTPIPFTYQTSSGTATENTDYQGASGSGTIGANMPYAVVSIPTLTDYLLEGPESFTFTLTGATGATIGTASTSVTIGDVAPSLVGVTPPNNHTAEGSGALFYLTISPMQSTSVTVNYRTLPGSAIENTDYEGKTGSATIPPYTGYVGVYVPTFHDFSAESAETFALEITSVTGAALDTSHASATMYIDDGAPSAPPSGGQTVTWSLSAAPITEPEDGAAEQLVTISLSAAVSGPITFNYATSDDTAEAGYDFTAASGTLTFAAGETEKTVPVEVYGDWTTEPSEAYVFTATPVGSTPAGVYLSPSAEQWIEAVIHDNGLWLGAPFGIADGSAWEADETGLIAGQVPFLIELDEEADRDIEFEYYLETGEAAIDQDFEVGSGTFTILAGQLEGTIYVDVINSTAVEPDETFFIHVFQVGTPLATLIAEGVIFDDDLGALEPSVGIVAIQDAPPVHEPTSTASSDAVYAHFLVTYTNPATENGSVEWYTESPNSGDATPGADYFTASGTLTLPPTPGGSQSIDVKVQIKYDTNYPEPDEPFSVKLRNPSGVNIGEGRGEGRGTIKEIPSSLTLPIQYTIHAVIPEADEVGRKPAGFTVMRTGPIDQPATVIFTISGDAGYDRDYYFTSMEGIPFAGGVADRVTIPAGNSAVSFLAVPMTDTTTPEPDETIILEISAIEPRGTPHTATAVIHDAGNRVTIKNNTRGHETPENDARSTSFTVSRWGSTSGDLWVNLSHGGTATLGDDYYVGSPNFSRGNSRTYFPSAIRIPNGAASADLVLQIVDDWKVEDPDETVIVSLATGTGYTIDPAEGSATLTIIDDDVVPTVSISPTNATVNEWGGGSVDLTISRTGSTEFALPVPFSISGNAAKSADYRLFVVRGTSETLLGSHIVTIDPGAGTATIRLRPIDDSFIEPIDIDHNGQNGEDAVISLDNSSRFVISPFEDSATVRIVDNEVPSGNWRVIRHLPRYDPAYTEWEWIGGGRSNQWGWVRRKLVPEWQELNSIPIAPAADDRTLTVGGNVTTAHARTWNIGGAISVGSEIPGVAEASATVSGAVEHQWAVSWGVGVTEPIDVPAYTSVEVVAVVLRLSNIVQRAKTPGESPPPDGAAGDEYVSEENGDRFWYTEYLRTWTEDFICTTGTYYVMLNP